MKKDGHNRLGGLFNGDTTTSAVHFFREGGDETTGSRDDGANSRSALTSAASQGLASLPDTSASDNLSNPSPFGASAFSAAISPALALVPINRDPVANGDSYTTRSNQALIVATPGLLGNDTDADGDALSVTSVDITGLK
ncbi:Ig-like domain-containing protein, partial [Candidatus Accumulibacter vicinus]